MGVIGVGRPTVIEVDLRAIARNVAVVKSRLGPGTRLMAVVKADGYGHGALPVARAALAAGADALGVALAEEGAALRAAGIPRATPMVVLGATAPDQVATVVDYGLEATVFDAETAEALSRRAQDRRVTVPVHVKVDTGMGRLGVAADGPVVELVRRLLRLPGIRVEGLMSHLADADHADPTYTARQYRKFLGVVEALRQADIRIPVLHLANSAGALRFPGLTLDMVRIGIALYGLEPYPGAPRLYPALSLKTRVVMVKRVPAGFAVGYGHTFVTPEPMVLATIPIGYADGYPRGLSNRGVALLHGRRVSVVGRVSMDQTVLGLPPDLDAAVGDEVVLLGEQGDDRITAAEWARWLDTIHYEVVTRFGPRIPRRYRVGPRVVDAESVDAVLLEAL
jgi:alanine racemase